MDKILKMRKNVDKNTFSLQEASDYLELSYGSTYKIIVQLEKVSYSDYGNGKKKNIRVDKKSLEEFKKSKFIEAKTE